MKELLTAAVQQEIEEELLAGAALRVIRHGETVYNAGFGKADREAGTPFTEKSIVRLYSSTKPVTSTAAMLLLQRGKLDLLDPVEKYLPGFQQQQYLTADGSLAPVPRPVLVKDLLNMTSGLVYPEESVPGEQVKQIFSQNIAQLFVGNPGLSTVDFCNALGKAPLLFAPGALWKYGTSADVLGAVIEQCSGKKFGDFLQEELFEPLGMEDTAFSVPAEKWERRAAIYYSHPEQEQKLQRYTDYHLCITDGKLEPGFQSGGAGLFSTLDDYAKLCTMLCQGGNYRGKQILGRKTVAFMAQNHLTPEQKVGYNWDGLVGYGYGNLLRVMESLSARGNVGSVGEFGWDGWAGTYAAIDPAEDLVILYFIQRLNRDNTSMRRKLHSIIYGALT